MKIKSNQCIERLWVDTGFQIIHLLEEEYGLDPSDDIHLLSLHYVYVPRITNLPHEFSTSWNNHPSRTTKRKNPDHKGVKQCPT